jgi:peptidoglycan hydrolase-like protein with peptidoglycan-binding domain
MAGALALLAALVVCAALIEWPRAASADTDKRVALVIGNGDYKAATRLDNPSTDARAVAASLKRLGFEVIEGYDLTMAQMRGAVAEFSAALPDAKAALVYYAGHGVSVDDENYILPTDIVLKNPTDLDLGAISVSLLLKQMKREDRVIVVILDACRDNPFAADLARSKSRSVVGERGLSRVEGDLARGTLIAFASDPKSVALDGRPGEHSPFTKALIDHLEDPDVPIDTVMNRVRSEVWEITKNKQLPWVNTSIIGEFSLNSQSAPIVYPGGAVNAPAQNLAAVAPDKLTQENLLWESAQHSNLTADYQAYLDAYPTGFYAQMARNRIASLSNALSSPTAPIVPPNPTGVSLPDLKSEVGTMEMEKSLNLTAADRKELQQRLTALQLDAGPATGAFDDKTRAAILDWQKKQELSPTGWLGPLQLAALKAESETSYRRLLAVRPMIPARPVALAPRPTMQTMRKPVVHARRAHAHVPDSGQQPAQTDNAPAAASFGGVASGNNFSDLRPCQPGTHSQSFPNPQGYRCVLNQ